MPHYVLINILVRKFSETWMVVSYIILAFLAVIYLSRKPLNKHLTRLGKDMATSEIAEIEEESAIEVNRKLGGIDTINADNLYTGINPQIQPLVFQTRHLGRLPSKLSTSNSPTNLSDNSTGVPQSVWHKYSGKQPFPSTQPITTTEGFQSSISSTNNTTTNGDSNPPPNLQLFYRMSCGHTQAFLPVWYEVVAALPLKSGTIRYEEINCEDSSDKCQAAKIEGVPTMRLVKYNPDGSESSNEEHTGPRTFEDIQQWLASRGIAMVPRLKVNIIENTMDASGIEGRGEGFSDIGGTAARIGHGNGGSDVGNQILDATGNLRKKYDQAYLDAAAIDEHGHYHDVTDSCYDATFSRCQPNSRNPGFQIFTHRGQWGCVRPEPGTGINSPFDAAFAVANQYLNTLPAGQIADSGKVDPIYDGLVENGEETKSARQDRMNKCARKYSKQLRGFGLCDLENLNEKYKAPDEIRRGRLQVPMEDMDPSDYEESSMAALAIYGACSPPT